LLVTLTSLRLTLAGALAAILFAPVGAHAADAPAPLSPDDQAAVDQASAYLQSISQVKGRFVQTDARGGVSQGELYLARPGRARFAYDPPSNLLVVSDGRFVSVTDPRLKARPTRYPLGSTPLSLFLAKNVRLDRGVSVSRVIRAADGFSLTARDARHPTQGEVRLSFSTDPIRLREWRLTDRQGRVTRVQITALEPTSGLDPALFTLKDAPSPPAAAESRP
jgi:outer membrane lipoprotein-sorting protein